MLYYLTKILKKKSIFKRGRRRAEVRALAIVFWGNHLGT